ncbi:saccharopine dehydrogenase [Bacteriovoracaceae bacterium]|nr:saccharopine dehydrogenase [Bacteriovoracaceae bacterium]
MIKSILLRHETKPFEERSPLTPKQAQILIEEGHKIYVEKSPTRVFKDEEFQRAGCHLLEAGSWKTSPLDTIILGLKELEDEDFDLSHRHIYFAHLYKGQDGAHKTLERFRNGDGKLYDLEYLVDENKKRVAAFGIWAGFVGAALGIELWCRQQLGETANDWNNVETYKNEDDLIKSQEKWLSKVGSPRVIVIGANGRCGRGAKDLLNKLNVSATYFGRKETKSENLQREILKHDILINTVLMTSKTKPFLTAENLKSERRLSVLSDVSCDPTGEFNPLPFYSQCTTMDQPAISIDTGKRFDITAIDHLPSLLPRESSEDFADQLFPHLRTLLSGKISNSPWERSLELFYKNIFKTQSSLIVKEIYQ